MIDLASFPGSVHSKEKESLEQFILCMTPR